MNVVNRMIKVSGLHCIVLVNDFILLRVSSCCLTLKLDTNTTHQWCWQRRRRQ